MLQRLYGSCTNGTGLVSLCDIQTSVFAVQKILNNHAASPMNIRAIAISGNSRLLHVQVFLDVSYLSFIGNVE